MFSGLLIEIETPVETPWILFRPELGAAMAALRSLVTPDSLQPLPMPGAASAAAFDVIADDPAAARARLAPVFVDTLRALELRRGAAPRLTAAFRGRRFHIALRRPRPFLRVAGLIDGPDGAAEACRAALEDLTLPRRLIDLLIDGAGAGGTGAAPPDRQDGPDRRP